MCEMKRAPERVEAMGAMALPPICDVSFACEDYNIYRAHPSQIVCEMKRAPGVIQDEVIIVTEQFGTQ